MNKTTFIEEIKKCFTLLQENHVIKKAIEDLYSKGSITQEDINQINNTLSRLENVIVNDSEINIGNGYRIYSTQEDGVYLYRGENQILHLNYNTSADEDDFNYYDIDIGKSESGQLKMSYNDEENYLSVVVADREGNANIIELSLQGFHTDKLRSIDTNISNLKLGYESKPRIDYLSAKANIYEGVLYYDTSGNDFLIEGSIVREDVFYLMKLLGKFYTFDGEETIYYTLHNISTIHDILLFIAHYIDSQGNTAKRMVEIENSSRVVHYRDYQE